MVPLGLLLLALPAAAQLKFEGVSSDLAGTISTGYTADYGNMTSSDHSWAVGGTGTFSGSFYNPNFLTFNATFFLNQSRANSDFQSISDASGVNVSTNLFSGSHYPGSVSYSKTFNSEGNYAVPGLANYVTHGNSDTFGVVWNENVPDKPSLSVGFQTGGGDYSVYGTDDTGKSDFKSLSLHSSYRYAGFNMGAYYTLGDGSALIPAIVSGVQDSESRSNSAAYGFNVSHMLPMQGAVAGGVNRTTYGSSYLGTDTTGAIDTMTGSASVHPSEKLGASASVSYSDNLTGQLISSIVSSGGAVPGLNDSQGSNSLDLLGNVSYNFVKNLQSSAFVERRAQSFLGEDYGVTSYGGSSSYGRPLLNGSFNASVTVTDNTSDQTDENALGFSGRVNFADEFLGWHVNGSFGYSQNVQTLLITYMNSFYNYSGNVRRRFGRLNVSAGASAGRTALTQDAGTASSSQSYSAGVGYSPWITANGSYSKASGQALATGAGLIPVPIPSPVIPSNLLSVYGGDSYSFGLSSSPAKKLLISGSYSKSITTTSGNAIASSNANTQYNGLVQYQFRKLNFNSGFDRLQQGFSGSGIAPEVISSFYFGVSRWFNFF
jgi:hypothetical protein